MTVQESMEFDVVIVGAGPAGLTAGIRLAQLSQQQQRSLSICVIDKGAEIGAHILSGAILEPRTLNELLPDWQQHYNYPHTPVTADRFLFLTEKKSWTLPTPPQIKNHGNYIISLGQLCRWLGQQAEQLGVNIFPGFAATEIIIENDQVCGVITGDKGVDTKNQPKNNYQPGMALRAKQVIFAEGCRGSLTQLLFKHFNLRANVDPQTYGLGIKELWEMPAAAHHAGSVMHSIGWPLNHRTYGGSFVYHFADNLLAIGLVVGLDYQNPYLNPYEEFQRFKTHPIIYPLLKQGRRIAYGARTLIEGGIQSLPKLTFPGGVIIGDAAGFLNVPKIKGIHTAMKSAMLAADSIFAILPAKSSTNKEPSLHIKDARLPAPNQAEDYSKQVKNSWLWQELYQARNIRPALRWGLWPGLCYAAIDTYLFRGRAPWTLRHKIPDHLSLKPAAQCKKINYPKHDNQVTFDRLSSVYLCHIQYTENQPYHLKLKDRHGIPITVNYQVYDSPEQRYCPAGVYEIVQYENGPRLHINGGNCIQCKACDIKDPMQNIVWTPSEGGSGPQYEEM
ncbi:MAG TPA: electron transfer flavoprotein-ubiquinone oxidoreductase [Gammaproteobacteria bacterium]|jgi:electron-transferring-flavoprotein dehydrogenase|nr:electron transfer flavoprotein-ubiquinone oxidoreductase [Gammaproteobacteria bacterium]